MLSRWPIRYKLWLGVVLLLLIVTTLAVSGFQGVYAYRRLARSISARADELPLAYDLMQRVGDLRVSFGRVRRRAPTGDLSSSFDGPMARVKFRADLDAVRAALRRYRDQLEADEADDPYISDTRNERETVARLEESLQSIERKIQDGDWAFDRIDEESIDGELAELEQLSGALPSHLQNRMHDLSVDVRAQYRTLIVVTWVTTFLAVGMLLLLVRFFYLWIFCPLRILVTGSRRVARGNFSHRIKLSTHDEMSELAAAMNDMTARFQEIRDDLDRQVKQRTKEVVRSEQLASVGFLAAGVSHEINNPLASIAWCAESLESRLFDILKPPAGEEPDEKLNEDREVLRDYLRRIQDEAFRCKGITDGLLDYSRMGDVERQATDLCALIEGVIDMVRHLGKYREKHIEFDCGEPVVAEVNPQEIKQVILNLVTNALDSLEVGGLVTIDLALRGESAEILVTDDGCGMTDEVLEHLFEPFFTRRRDGQGTGLGLSITFRIISEHGGRIEAASDGAGRGSQFRVTIPLICHEKTQQRLQAA